MGSLIEAMDELRLVQGSTGTPIGISTMGTQQTAGIRPSLSQADFPEARFWTKKAWLDYRKALKEANSGRGEKLENGVLGFVTGKSGECVSPERLGDMRKSALGILRTMAKDPNTGVPDTWGRRANHTQRRAFYTELEQEFPELSLCESHWKADSVAIEVCSHFDRDSAFGGHLAKRKLESDDDSLEPIASENGSNHGPVPTPQDRTSAPTKPVIPRIKRRKPAAEPATSAVKNPL